MKKEASYHRKFSPDLPRITRGADSGNTDKNDRWSIIFSFIFLCPGASRTLGAPCDFTFLWIHCFKKLDVFHS